MSDPKARAEAFHGLLAIVRRQLQPTTEDTKHDKASKADLADGLEYGFMLLASYLADISEINQSLNDLTDMKAVGLFGPVRRVTEQIGDISHTETVFDPLGTPEWAKEVFAKRDYQTMMEFGMWLTTRPGSIVVGAEATVYAMTTAIAEYATMKGWDTPSSDNDRFYTTADGTRHPYPGGHTAKSWREGPAAQSAERAKDLPDD